MSTSPAPRRSAWPLAFFILNILALILWFHLSGLFVKRDVNFHSLTPSGEEVKPAGIETLEVKFDHDLDPASVAKDALRLIPPVAGEAELADPRTIRYRLRDKLSPATTYRVLWSPQLRGNGGQIIPQELCGFATARPKLLSSRQAGFDQGSYTLELVFNQPVRAADLTEALRDKFSLDPEDRPDGKRLTVVTSGVAKTHLVKIRENRAGWLALTLPAGFSAAEGNLGLAESGVVVCRLAGRAGQTAAEPEWVKGREVVDLSPRLDFVGMEANWGDDAGEILVRTTAPLDNVGIDKFVKVEPTPAEPLAFSGDWRGLKIRGAFQPGRQYRVSLLAGLPAGDAGDLAETVSRNVWFDDRPSSLEFAFGGGYLLPGGLLTVPVNSVNVDKFHLRVRKLYPANLVEMAMGDYGPYVEEERAARVGEKDYRPDRRRNEKVETLLDLRQCLGSEPRGVYGLEIAPAGEPWRDRSAVAVVSDIGLTTRLGKDQLFLWTLSLAGAKPLAACEVILYSNRRQELAKGVTGKDGTLSLVWPKLPEGEKPMLVLARLGDEFTFVNLDRNKNARGEAERQGSAYPDFYQAFVSAERGVYRGGEKIHVSALVRDGELATVPSLPVEISLAKPDGKVIAKAGAVTGSEGRVLAELVVPADAAGGLHQLRVRLPGGTADLGSASLRLADYLPVTFRLNSTLPEKIDPASEAKVAVQVVRLAGGSPGRLKGTVRVAFSGAPFAPKEWSTWTFGDRRIVTASRQEIERELATEPDGAGSAAWSVPNLPTQAAIDMRVYSEMLEPGGRAFSDETSRTIHPLPFYLGAKLATPAAAGGEVEVDLLAVDGAGQFFPTAKNWSAQLYRVEFTSLLRRQTDGRLVYEQRRREIPAGGELRGAFQDGRAVLAFTPELGGNYRLVAEAPEGKAVTLDFEVSGPGSVWSGEDPEALAVTLDQESYPVDSVAVATIKTPFAGQALVTLESDRVVRHWLKELAAGENRFEITIDDTLRPNAYLAVTVVRPVRAEALWQPHRAAGVARLSVDNHDRRLTATLTAPEFFSPGQDAEVTVRVADPAGKPAAGAAVTLWGVDEGILSLTGYRLPSPYEHFYRPRRLGVADADMYSRLAPELSAWRIGKEAAPGGDAAAGWTRRLSPISAERVKPALIYRGDLTTGADGMATAKFRLPEAATKLRLFAWTARGQQLGAGETEREIKAPVAVRSSWPRFAAPGDEFTVTATLTNRSGLAATAILEVREAVGLAVQPERQNVAIPDGESREVTLRVTAGRSGTARVKLAARLGDVVFSEAVELAVRPPVLFQRRSGTVEVSPASPFSMRLGEGLLATGGRVDVVAGGSPQIKLAGVLDYLVGYPYECAEQTASRLAALVALPDLLALARPGSITREDASKLADNCLARLAALQNANGGYRMWPGEGDSLFWVSAQILYLLEECVNRGWEIPDQLNASCRNYLRDRLEEHLDLLTEKPGTAKDSDPRYQSGEDAALALLALAKGDSLRRAWLVRFGEIALEREAAGRPLSAAALAFHAAATAAAGDPGAAREIFASHASAAVAGPLAGAAWLAAGLRLGLPETTLLPLAQRLDASLDGESWRWNTRENAFVLLALGGYWQRFRPEPGVTAEVNLEGRVESFSTERGKAWLGLTPGQEIQATAAGGVYHLSWRSEGVPTDGAAVPEEDAGLRLRRRVFGTDGKEITGQPVSLRQGAVYRIRLEVSGQADDLVVADLLPAGLEIEDADLQGRRLDDKLPAGGLRVNQVERKDDRLLLFGEISGEGVYEYLARAVTVGSYVWPAADAGRMYDTQVRSVRGRTRLQVTAADELRRHAEIR